MKRPADPEQEWRRKRLHDALRQHFENNKAAMGRALGYETGAFMHQMLVGIRPVTEKTVRQIEALPGLLDWFKKPTDSGGLHISDQAEIAVIMNFRAWVARQRESAGGNANSSDDDHPESPSVPPPPTASRLVVEPKLGRQAVTTAREKKTSRRKK